ncbi:MAG: complex I subunit 1 family protein [Planctomycetota bacterium]
MATAALFILALVGTAALGLASKWIDRKVTARIQWRVGPPWYQPLADFVKLLGKETILPESARGTGFLLAPIIALAATAVAAAILWAANFRPGVGFVGDVIVVLYLLTIPSLALILGGSASGNPNASAGASREMKLLLSYELPFIVAILAAALGSGRSLSLSSLVGAHATNGLAAAGSVLGFIVAVFVVQAKLGLVPFDIAEAECEIMSGPYVEYSGGALALWYLTRAMLTAILPVFVITVFWGGMLFTSLGAAAASIGKYVLVLVLTVLIRNTNPRVRIDHAMRFFWFFMTPVAALALILTLSSQGV